MRNNYFYYIDRARYSNADTFLPFFHAVILMYRSNFFLIILTIKIFFVKSHSSSTYFSLYNIHV